MKVVIVGNYYPPKYGGVEMFTIHLSKELARLGHKVELVCAGGPTRGEFERDGVRTKLLRSRDLLGVPVALSLLRGIGKDFDVLHVTMPSPLNPIFALVWCRLLGKKLLLNILSFPTTGGLLSAIYNRLVLPLILRLVHLVVIPTRRFALRSAIRAFFANYARKVEVVPIGVDHSVFRPNLELGEQTRRVYGISENAILFVGALDRARWFKGLEHLMAAVSLLVRGGVDTQLVVIGDGDRRRHYEELAESMGLGDRVRFLGNVPNAELHKFYNACLCLVLPSVSHTESFGIVLAEAMSCGKPVVSSDVGGLTEVVEGSGVLIRPGDVGALSKELFRLLTDEEHYGRIAERCLTKAKGRFSWGKVALEYERLYRRVLGG